MKTVLELATEIEKNKEGYKALLDLFKTTDDGLRLVLLAYKELPAEIVPPLLRTYNREKIQHEISSKRLTVNDVVNVLSGVHIFELEEDQKTYVFRGNLEGKAMFTELGKSDLVALNLSSPVGRLF
jgi:hypothetical protein